MKMKKWEVVIICICIISTVSFWIFIQTQPTADEVMRDFHEAKDRAEDMLMDPLILNSEIVKEHVIEDIKNPNMDGRRYAIGFLGNERIEEGLPVLRQILDNPQEEFWFRADALESIYQINREEGLDRATKYQDREDLLGFIAKGLLTGTYKPERRTYLQALTGHHE